MAELIDENHVLPHRIFSMVSIVAQRPGIRRSDLLRLVQPEVLSENTRTSDNIFNKCRICGLIEVKDDKMRTTSLAVDPVVATDWGAFRRYMQSTVLGVVRDECDFFSMNLFTAWYATQDEWPLISQKADWERKFNDDLFPGSKERLLSEHPGITAWMEWADFLGWGWQLKFGTRETDFVPDVTARLSPLIPTLLPHEASIPFRMFMQRMAPICPELDGGVLFERCLTASRPGERRGNRLSLMLSTALRVLDQQGEIVLDNHADASENWSLYQSQSYLNRVTHIGRGRGR